MAGVAAWNARLSALLSFDALEIIEYLLTLTDGKTLRSYLDALIAPPSLTDKH